MSGVELFCGDCVDVLPGLPANSVDSVITDPPYGLRFMGRDWDRGVPGVAFWSEVLRVAKPGALMLAFGGTRTFHRLTCAIEDAGWEVRDCLMWLYGSGFPKGLNLRGNGWDGWGTALKPAWEPILLAMKPLDGTFAGNAQRWGVAGLNVDGARIEVQEPGRRHLLKSLGDLPPKNTFGNGLNGSRALGTTSQGRWPANVLLDEEAAAALDAQSGKLHSNSGNYGKYAQRSSKGITDTGGASRFFYVAKASRSERNAGLEGDGNGVQCARPESPDMSGKFPDHDGRERGANHHPTVKPLALMRYLCRLTMTPAGGVVCDPFMGSGTTGVAAVMEGREFVGIELDAGYFEVARRRIEAAGGWIRG